MTTAEGGALDAGLMVALSLLLPGEATAQLWACVLDASGNDRSDGSDRSDRSGYYGIDTFVTALTDAASAIAGIQLASAFGL